MVLVVLVVVLVPLPVPVLLRVPSSALAAGESEWVSP
jgi:hypothetical protein